VKTIFKNGIEHIIATPNDLTTHFVQIVEASDFSLSKVQDFPQTFFCSTSSFLKGYFEAKKFRYGRIGNIRPLLCKFSQHFLFP
jgi:hypothetical protein